MQSPFYFIAKPIDSKRYDNTRDIEGVDVIVNVSEEDYRFSNRQAEVIEVPLGYNGPIKPGYTLLVHHNTFKFYNDIKGRRKSGKSFFMEDLFFIEPDQFFLYKNDDDWNAYDKYCFVKPISPNKSYINKATTHEPLMGEMVYVNEELKRHGIVSGDKVCFQPDSEYEFYVDGEKLYRMFDHQITIKL